MPNKKKPELLPGIKYDPPDVRGGGDYEYYNRANSYASNPDYAQNFGGGGGAPPVLPSPLQGSAREGYAHGDMPIDQIIPWIGEQIGNMDRGFGASNSNPLFFGSTVSGQGNLGRGVPQASEGSPVPQWMTGAGAGSYADSRAQEVAGGAPQYIQDAFRNYYQQNPNGASPTYPNREGGVADGAIINRGGAGATGENNPLGAGLNNPNEPGPMANQYNRLQDATNKNQALTEKAKAAGDDKEMKRLDDEWARLTSSPLFQKMYGGQDAFDVKNRLINSYMQPGNDAAEPSFDRAHGRMVMDDIWAEAATVAFGRGPNQVEWDEHWRAMNKGGRDPLEGHPAAIQVIDAKKKELEQMNQQSAYDMLQQWQAKSGNL
jgi:hypothetical protein